MSGLAIADVLYPALGPLTMKLALAYLRLLNQNQSSNVTVMATRSVPLPKLVLTVKGLDHTMTWIHACACKVSNVK